MKNTRNADDYLDFPAQFWYNTKYYEERFFREILVRADAFAAKGGKRLEGNKGTNT